MGWVIYYKKSIKGYWDYTFIDSNNVSQWMSDYRIINVVKVFGEKNAERLCDMLNNNKSRPIEDGKVTDGVYNPFVEHHRV